jgi:hypothetical protein
MMWGRPPPVPLMHQAMYFPLEVPELMLKSEHHALSLHLPESIASECFLEETKHKNGFFLLIALIQGKFKDYTFV